jgi:hypothetical protein
MTFLGERRPAEGELAPGPPTTFGEVYDAAAGQARYVDNFYARERALEEAFDLRIDDVFKATGQRLDNPMRYDGRWAMEEPVSDGGTPGTSAVERAIGRFDADIARLGEMHPDKHDMIKPSVSVLEQAREKARFADKAAEDATARYGGVWGGGFVAGVLGGIRGSVEDPVNLVGNLLGPSAKAGLGLKQMLWMGIKQGAANSAIETGLQPGIAAWRKEAGLGYDAGDFARNVGGAFVLGAGLDMGVRGTTRAVRTYRGDLPVLDGEGKVTGWETPETRLDRAAMESSRDLLRQAQGGDIAALRQLAEETGHIDEPGVRSTFEHLDDIAATDRRPPGVDIDEHDDWMAQLARALTLPDEPVPRAPDPVPEARGPSLADDRPLPVEARKPAPPAEPRPADPVPTAPPTQGFSYDGKPVAVETGRGEGRALVLEDAAGARTLIDGPPSHAETLVFRAADGWDETAVRTIALRRQLQNGTLDTLQTAALLRERPEVLDATVSLASAEMRAARAVARLSDAAFEMVAAGDAHPRLGALVADLVPAPDQARILEALVKADTKTPAAARGLIARLLEPPRDARLKPGMKDALGPQADAQVAALEAGLGGVQRTAMVHPDHPEITLPLNAHGSVTLYRGDAPTKRPPVARRMFTLDLEAARSYATLDGTVAVIHVSADRAGELMPRADRTGKRIPGEFFLPDEIARGAVRMPGELERRIALGASRAQAAEAALAIGPDIPDMAAIKAIPGHSAFERGTLKILDAVRRGGLPAVEAELKAMDRAGAADAAARLAGHAMREWPSLADKYRAPLLAAGAIRRWAWAAEPGDLRARLLAAADDLDILAKVPQPEARPNEPPLPRNFVSHPEHKQVRFELRDDGMVRLYRGERPDRAAKGAFGHRLFTTDLERALRNVRAEGGILRTIDVPEARLGELDPRRSGDRKVVNPGTDVFTLPEDLAAAAKSVDGEALSVLDAATRAAAPRAEMPRRATSDVDALGRLDRALADGGDITRRDILNLARKAEDEALRANPDMQVRRNLDDVSALQRLKDLMEACKDG